MNGTNPALSVEEQSDETLDIMSVQQQMKIPASIISFSS